MDSKAKALFIRRQERSRYKLSLAQGTKCRLTVFRSNLNIHAQIIDDINGKTLVSCSTVEKDIRGALTSTANVAAAALVGKTIAERAKAAKINEVIFDRGGYRYHGRVKAVCEAARESGLKI